MKDINWKTSSRLNQLITRISPLALDKEMLLQISFRHYKFDTKETLSSTLHLEYLKRGLQDVRKASQSFLSQILRTFAQLIE